MTGLCLEPLLEEGGEGWIVDEQLISFAVLASNEDDGKEQRQVQEGTRVSRDVWRHGTPVK